MCAKLLILESPGKVKKVQEILGPGWKVAASVGHVRDLPVKEMGVAAPDFKPQYLPTDRGKDVLSRLAGLVKNAEEVFLATDPDREGEAIAWHLQDALKLKNAKRVSYTEITEPAIRVALSAPRSIDTALVAAQAGAGSLLRLHGFRAALQCHRRKALRWPGAKPGCPSGGGERKGNQSFFQHNALRRGIDL